MIRAARRQRHPLRRPALVMRALTRRIAAVVAECQHAQRRLAVLQASPERYLPDAGRAPGTYQEFLFRTSGLLAHEPAAGRRSAGRAVH